MSLNDTQFVEASRAFAQRILLSSKKSDDERLNWAFAESTSRTPNAQEASVLLKAINRERARYAAHRDLAQAYVGVGESPVDPTLDIVELAAWSQFAAILLNLSETVTRN